MEKYYINITEGKNKKTFTIKAQDTEQAIYEIENTIQLWMGIKFLNNLRKSYLYKNFENIINELNTKGISKLHESITVKKVGFLKQSA